MGALDSIIIEFVQRPCRRGRRLVSPLEGLGLAQNDGLRALNLGLELHCHGLSCHPGRASRPGFDCTRCGVFNASSVLSPVRSCQKNSPYRSLAATQAVSECLPMQFGLMMMLVAQLGRSVDGGGLPVRVLCSQSGKDIDSGRATMGQVEATWLPVHERTAFCGRFRFPVRLFEDASGLVFETTNVRNRAAVLDSVMPVLSETQITRAGASDTLATAVRAVKGTSIGAFFVRVEKGRVIWTLGRACTVSEEGMCIEVQSLRPPLVLGLQLELEDAESVLVARIARKPGLCVTKNSRGSAELYRTPVRMEPRPCEEALAELGAAADWVRERWAQSVSE